MKTAFIFPGQGAQYVGMAQDFYENVPESREIFETAAKALGFDMAKLCFEENKDLNETEFTQAAILTACTAVLRAVEKEGVIADVTAGLSLGEYSALVANGVFTFEEAVKAVRKRGIYMANEVPSGKGTMAAILGLETEKVEEICKEITNQMHSPVEPANYNCPGQIAISGEKQAVLAACERLKEAGAKRAVELKVSGPFHSSMLKGAGEKLAAELESMQLHEMKMPYVTNVTAGLIEDTGRTKELLKAQVSSPVKWEQSMRLLIEKGVDTFIEIGPGKTLSGFMKRIDRTKKVINIDKLADMEKLKEL